MVCIDDTCKDKDGTNVVAGTFTDDLSTVAMIENDKNVYAKGKDTVNWELN